MRGADQKQGMMFSYVSLEARIPEDHPLRAMREMTDAALKKLSRRFSRMYAKTGRPSIAPEKLLRALLLQILYTIRSERQLVEQLDYNLLFRWFVGLEMDESVWNATTFTKNRDRLLKGDIAQAFLAAVVDQARDHGLLSADHFTVDGTLIEAWAGHKSFRPKDGSDDDDEAGNFHGQRRSNQTHESKTDPDSRLYRKGNSQGASLCYMGHALSENRNGIVVRAGVSVASGYAERDTALELLDATERSERCTLGADKGYDTRDFVDNLRERGVTPHVAQNTSGRSSRIDGRTTRHDGYEISQRKRKQIEQVFGWGKVVGGLRKMKHRGRERVDWVFTFSIAVYNLVRMRTLCAT
jgi:transposase